MRTEKDLKAAVDLCLEIIKQALKKKKHEPVPLNKSEVSKIKRERIEKEKS